MKKYFKLKFGYDVMDFISIPEEELPRAINAWHRGLLYSFGDKMVKGSEIKSITPHFQRYTGWIESYEPRDSDDFEQIARDCPQGLNSSIEKAKMFLEDGGDPKKYLSHLYQETEKTKLLENKV